MQQDIQMFDFEGNEVRTAIVDDEPWWVAADVCSVLGIANPSDALSRLDEAEKGVASADTLGGRQDLATINESGLWSLVLTSRKKKAKEFKKWLTADVIPKLRKYGRYDESVAKYKPSDLDIINSDPRVAQARMLVDVLENQVIMENRVKAVEANVKQATDVANKALSIVSGETGDVTVAGFCSTRKLKNVAKFEGKLGKGLSKYCRDSSITIGSVPDRRWGFVNTYPIVILERWLSGDIVLPGILVNNNTVYVS